MLTPGRFVKPRALICRGLIRLTDFIFAVFAGAGCECYHRQQIEKLIHVSTVLIPGAPEALDK